MIKRYIGLSKTRQLVAAMGLCTSSVLLVMVVTTVSGASHEVLSDMDCVVEPGAVVELGSAVPGLLLHTYFDRSDYVEEGTVVARLESSIEQASLVIAQETARQSTAIKLRRLTASFGNRTRERNRELVKTASISRQSMDQVDTESRIAGLQVQQAEENLRLAKLDVTLAEAVLGRRQIVSPVSGTIVRRMKAAGEYVDREAVYRVAQLNPLNIEVIIPIEYLGQIETGMRGGIQLLVPGFENRVLEAEVRRIDAVADAASGTFGIRLILENPDFTIPSGVRCQVDIFAS